MSFIANTMLIIVVGGIVGWLASRVPKLNAPMEILLGAGVAGSLLGVAIAYVMDFGPYGPVGSAIVCIVGAALLIAVLDTIGVFGKLAPAR
jgi:uncharacterized membrane protein YeaQ/YmgE (transglycosylase-associated protein family)